MKASILQAELERPKYSREDIIEWISRFKYGDPSNKEYQRQIIDIFLNSIYVFDDRLVFTYNYKNGTQTVSLADVSAAFGSDLKSCTPPKKHRNFDTMGIKVAVLLQKRMNDSDARSSTPGPSTGTGGDLQVPDRA